MRTRQRHNNGMRTKTFSEPQPHHAARVSNDRKDGHGSTLEIRRTLPDHLRAVAANLYYLAFEQKLGSLIGPNARGARLLLEGLNSDSGLFAFDGEQLVGLVGFQLHG